MKPGSGWREFDYHWTKAWQKQVDGRDLDETSGTSLRWHRPLFAPREISHFWRISLIFMTSTWVNHEKSPLFTYVDLKSPFFRLRQRFGPHFWHWRFWPISKKTGMADHPCEVVEATNEVRGLDLLDALRVAMATLWGTSKNIWKSVVCHTGHLGHLGHGSRYGGFPISMLVYYPHLVLLVEIPYPKSPKFSQGHFQICRYASFSP